MNFKNQITNYKAHTWIFCIDTFIKPNLDRGEWANCPFCRLEPLIWEFNNSRSTACGCWADKYDHFSIHAESICSVHKRTNSKKMTEYRSDDLRTNWNHWCRFREILFEHANKRCDNRW